MKIISIEIENWRNFENIELEIPEESTLVCLVGENGTGKSNILELLAVASSELGISSGVQLPRGNPLDEIHSFSVTLKLSDVVLEEVIDQLDAPHKEWAENWDGILKLTTKKEEGKDTEKQIFAIDGVLDQYQVPLGNQIKNVLRQTREIYNVYLDADRAYPPVNIRSREIVEAERKEWETWEWRRQWAQRPTRDLYEEWIKYFLAKERQNATTFAQAARRAKEKGEEQPDFNDPFTSYKESLESVLPHLNFRGIDENQQTIALDSVGTSLKFWQLSGGEREIAFLIGQIDRFQLRRGLLLLDEPELHLNPDLVRLWVSFLRDTIDEGQVWIATHSLEAVEVTGPSATLVFEREEESRVVKRVNPLGERPIINILSAAVGSPAFSISKLRFILIEGDRQGYERERFFSLCGNPTTNRFLEAGNCNQVLSKIEVLRELSEETEERLRLGAIIDRDFRSNEEVEDLESERSIHVTRCHEVENLYLQPEAIDRILQQNGIDRSVSEVLNEASDQFAGRWILTKSLANLRDLELEVTREVRQLAGELTYQNFESDTEDIIESIILEFNDLGDDNTERLREELHNSYQDYSELVDSDIFWKKCFGKEVLGTIPGLIGLRDKDIYMRSVDRLWREDEIPRSDELIELREYVEEIEVT
jgi:predicted ATPase